MTRNNTDKIIFTLLLVMQLFTIKAIAYEYSWLNQHNDVDTMNQRIPAPTGFDRITVSQDSFADWLRHLPLKQGKPPVYLYDGRKKYNQSAHYAIIDIDIGTQDLQQCADAVIRLKAEYLYSQHRYKAIHFNFTSGDNASYQQWIQGYRPLVRGNSVRWRKTHRYNTSYPTFKKYLNTVFMYAGTYSLNRELQSVTNINDMQIGDVFIKGGFPGHAIIVIDMALNQTTGKKIFLLAQSYMPAQNIHILKNPSNQNLSPWYELDFGTTLDTPEWMFKVQQLKRF